VYSFEDFRLDPARKLLLRAGETVPVTHKAFGVLLVLVENNGRLVSKEELMSSVWHDSIVEDANLTQTISVLRKTLGENPNNHRFIVTEPGKGYRFVAPVTAAGDEPYAEESVGETPSVDRPNHFKFALAAVLGIVLVGGAVYLWNKSATPDSQPASASEVKAIAVLPFHSIESNDEGELLGIGMADAVITRLSQLKSIVVRQTRMMVRNTGATPEAISVGREINVDAVLEGNIQKADGRIRVSVRLYRVSDGSLLWAESFDERDADIFALQDSISEKVANSLSLQLNPDEREKLKRRYTENLEAYQLYNKGRYFWNNRSSADLQKSIDFYDQAIAMDGNYALAYSGLAESYVLLHLFGPNQDKDAFLKAKQAAVTALSLDEDLVGARTALAMYKAQNDWDWEGADREFKRAVATNPSYATAHQTYGEFLGFIGRTEESIAQIEKAFELDPLSLSTNTARAFPYMVAGRFDESIEKLKPALELEPNFPLALYYLGRSYEGKGMYKEAIVEYQKAIQNSGGSTFFISASIRALVKSGERKEGEKRLSDLLRSSQNQPISTYVLARAYASLGEREKALAKLEQAFNERDGLMHVIKVDPNFEDFRGEPRFQAILGEMNLKG
jgi:DNA-binding winged helix-turn-helix (wHTH) protein/TolB-like protein/Tfp pilus assembly protein PilF